VDREPGARGVAEGADAVVPRVKRVVFGGVGREEKNVYEPIEKKRKKEKKTKKKKKKWPRMAPRRRAKRRDR
jgi:hypothetical protein